MAIIKAVNSKSSIARAINYITKAEKTEKKLISGIDCNPETAIDEMKATKELYDKNIIGLDSDVINKTFKVSNSNIKLKEDIISS